jgi:hypothetical protein
MNIKCKSYPIKVHLTLGRFLPSDTVRFYSTLSKKQAVLIT